MPYPSRPCYASPRSGVRDPISENAHVAFRFQTADREVTMKSLMALAVVALAGTILELSVHAQPRPVITIGDVGGRMRGEFVPLDQPVDNPDTAAVQFATTFS